VLDWLRGEPPQSDEEVRRDLRRFVPEYQPAARVPLRVVATPEIAKNH
jgi:hypothetical protein